MVFPYPMVSFFFPSLGGLYIPSFPFLGQIKVYLWEIFLDLCFFIMIFLVVWLNVGLQVLPIVSEWSFINKSVYLPASGDRAIFGTLTTTALGLLQSLTSSIFGMSKRNSWSLKSFCLRGSALGSTLPGMFTAPMFTLSSQSLQPIQDWEGEALCPPPSMSFLSLPLLDYSLVLFVLFLFTFSYGFSNISLVSS